MATNRCKRCPRWRRKGIWWTCPKCQTRWYRSIAAGWVLDPWPPVGEG